MPRKYHRQLVGYRGAEPAGTIVVDPYNKFLYHVHGDGRAGRYGIGVGKEGFAWNGRAKIGAKKPWPTNEEVIRAVTAEFGGHNQDA